MDKPRGDLRVVVADDDDSVRMLLKVTLGMSPGFEVVGEAANGEEAITMTELCRADVVVLDHMMPGCTGAMAARRIRQMHPTIDIVFFTAYEDALPEVAAELYCTVVPKSGIDELEQVMGTIARQHFANAG
ncbi:MAG: response regulator transcription factor [Actinomycetota bacterium]